MGFHEVQGFLFAIVCSPELIAPSEWLPLIFNDQDAHYTDMEQAQSVMQTMMDLYNVINTQVFVGEVALPEDIVFKLPALENVGQQTSLGQWSRGFFLGHEWLMDLWTHYTPDALDQELGSCVMILSFFSGRELAEAYYQEVAQRSGSSLDAFAETLLARFEDAMNSYALLARSIQTALSEQPQEPYVSEPKPGRNDPCPCGSGKKYKKCCMHVAK